MTYLEYFAGVDPSAALVTVPAGILLAGALGVLAWDWLDSFREIVMEEMVDICVKAPDGCRVEMYYEKRQFICHGCELDIDEDNVYLDTAEEALGHIIKHERANHFPPLAAFAKLREMSKGVS